MSVSDFEITTGMNIYQKASFQTKEKGLDYESSRKLNFLEILSVTKGLDIISDFYDVNAAVVISGTNVVSVTLGKTLEDAINDSVSANPVDFLKSTIVVSSEVTSDFVKMLAKSNLIVAPKFTKNAIDYLEMHEIGYIIINTPLKEYKQYLTNQIIETPLGILEQTPNYSDLDKDTFIVVTKKIKPTVEQIEDSVFAWKVAKHVKTQAVVIAKDLKTSAISQGQTCSSVEYALNYSCELAKEAILASDLPLEITDLNAAIQCRVGLVIVPFATKDVIDYADKYGIILITTGVTNYLY